ncbi:adenylate/guanylate cyclase domain-containing protein [Sneathiella aquimaris]|uniref:adenylate/guanylate cyclase domain-containing protein n=1 Tax=Sneathiella aquimaris TaxID=2599305 RepID=UPI00146D0140|nr:adenylate/guanylate cyclase domain-containing protein [Sneathiella aquimaris]
MTTVEKWLLTEGRLIPEVLDFIEQLCERINQSGISLSRLRIGVRTIHPQNDIWAYTWTDEDKKAKIWGAAHGIRSTDSYFGSPAEYVHSQNKPFRKTLTDLDPDKDHPVLFEQRDAGQTDYIMFPMPFMDRSKALISYVTADPAGFSNENLTELGRLIDYIAPIMEIHSTREVAITLLNTYLGRRSGKQVMNGQIQRGTGETIEAALWFSDIRGYTQLSEELAPSEVFSLLNTYFQILSDLALEYGGEVLKFIGDAVLIIFPVDQKMNAQQACENAVHAAQDAFKQFELENRKRALKIQPLIDSGVALHFGEVVYGNVGAIDRLDFTVTGPAVNLTARLEELTKETKEPLLLSAALANQLTIPTKHIGTFPLKGIREATPVFILAD